MNEIRVIPNSKVLITFFKKSFTQLSSEFKINPDEFWF